MIKDDSSDSGSRSDPSEATRIDLGDDLIEKTAIIPGQSAPNDPTSGFPPPQTTLTNEEQVASARAYLAEGFSEEAKKILRHVLLSDENDLSARRLIDQIHEGELKQMFGSAESVPRKSFFDSSFESPFGSYDESILDADSEELIRLLDRDMQLGVEATPHELSLFTDAKLLSEFSQQLDREMGDSVSDRVDLAIGFIEMGLHSVAIRILKSVTASSREEDRMNGCALTAYSHLVSAEPYRAISVLQPILNDNDIEKSRKTESFYLMGRAAQALLSYAEAVGWYQQAQENEADYRDCAERISRCRKALAGK